MAGIALVVTSDSVYRGEKPDEVTPLVESYAAGRGHRLAYRRVVPNDPAAIEEAVLQAVEAARVVLVTGGTGISPHDVTVDVVARLSTREVPGFGEAHRAESLRRIGPRAILSRATAYIVRGSFVAVTPGNPDAVKLALEILDPIIDHIIEQLEGKKHTH